MLTLPAPAEVRAIVVGIEEYRELGQDFRVPGAAAAAVAFARWLVLECGVAIGAVELWLAPAGGTDPVQLCVDAGLTALAPRHFEWATFRDAMAMPPTDLAGGSFLAVYYCGHGAVAGSQNSQHLVLPEASKHQFRCIELANWRALFSSGDWTRFSHQLWVVDACRNKWGVALNPIADHWQVGQVAKVERCSLSSCGEGEVASVSYSAGPRYTKELLATLAADPGRPWPDFDRAFTHIALLLRGTGPAPQSPAVLLESWAGVERIDGGTTAKQLAGLLDQIPWNFKEFLPYVMRAQAMSPPGFSRPASFKQALALLAELAPVDEIEPIIDFAHRVADAAGNAPLREWVRKSLTPRQQATLTARRRDDPVFVRLSLWFYSDDEGRKLDAALEIPDGSRGMRAWTRPDAKPVAPGRELAVIGEWVQAVYEHLGWDKFDLEVELFLEADVLARADFDIAVVPLTDDDELKLGEECAAVLRCADRYKAGKKLQTLLSVAPGVLARHGTVPDPLRWAAAGDDPDQLVRAFIGKDPEAPVWLGFDAEPGDASALLAKALRSGLPAAIWLRATPSVLTPGELRGKLRTLLAGTLDSVPAALKALRCDEQDAAARSVALLLDDPSRIPAIFSRMTQPGE